MAENQAGAEKAGARRSTKDLHAEQTKDVRYAGDDEREDRQDDNVTVGETVDPVEHDKGEPSDKEKKRAERDAKIAEEQAEQDEADIEAFLAVTRGERILRGQDGSFDHIAFRMAQREERLAKVREEAGDDEDDQEKAVRDHEADEKARERATSEKSQDVGTKDLVHRQG
jgi:hypothetical protein